MPLEEPLEEAAEQQLKLEALQKVAERSCLALAAVARSASAAAVARSASAAVARSASASAAGNG
jgi:hypothetical protein